MDKPRRMQVEKFKTRYTCNICGNALATERNLKRHVEKLHYEVTCNFCSRLFTNRQELEYHKLSHKHSNIEIVAPQLQNFDSDFVIFESHPDLEVSLNQSAEVFTSALHHIEREEDPLLIEPDPPSATLVIEPQDEPKQLDAEENVDKGDGFESVIVVAEPNLEIQGHQTIFLLSDGSEIPHDNQELCTAVKEFMAMQTDMNLDGREIHLEIDGSVTANSEVGGNNLSDNHLENREVPINAAVNESLRISKELSTEETSADHAIRELLSGWVPGSNIDLTTHGPLMDQVDTTVKNLVNLTVNNVEETSTEQNNIVMDNFQGYQDNHSIIVRNGNMTNEAPLDLSVRSNLNNNINLEKSYTLSLPEDLANLNIIGNSEIHVIREIIEHDSNSERVILQASHEVPLQFENQTVYHLYPEEGTVIENELGVESTEIVDQALYDENKFERNDNNIASNVYLNPETFSQHLEQFSDLSHATLDKADSQTPLIHVEYRPIIRNKQKVKEFSKPPKTPGLIKSDKIASSKTHKVGQKDVKLKPPTKTRVRRCKPIKRLILEKVKVDAKLQPKGKTCCVCDKSFLTLKECRIHEDTHLTENIQHVYQCQVCQKSFKTLSLLYSHMRRHPKEQPFQCPTCDKKCSQSSELYLHQMSHEKKKNFLCKYCGNSYSRPHNLNRHRIAIHNINSQCHISDAFTLEEWKDYTKYLRQKSARRYRATVAVNNVSSTKPLFETIEEAMNDSDNGYNEPLESDYVSDSSECDSWLNADFKDKDDLQKGRVDSYDELFTSSNVSEEDSRPSIDLSVESISSSEEQVKPHMQDLELIEKQEEELKKLDAELEVDLASLGIKNGSENDSELDQTEVNAAPSKKKKTKKPAINKSSNFKNRSRRYSPNSLMDILEESAKEIFDNISRGIDMSNTIPISQLQTVVKKPKRKSVMDQIMEREHQVPVEENDYLMEVLEQSARVIFKENIITPKNGPIIKKDEIDLQDNEVPINEKVYHQEQQPGLSCAITGLPKNATNVFENEDSHHQLAQISPLNENFDDSGDEYGLHQPKPKSCVSIIKLTSAKEPKPKTNGDKVPYKPMPRFSDWLETLGGNKSQKARKSFPSSIISPPRKSVVRLPKPTTAAKSVKITNSDTKELDLEKLKHQEWVDAICGSSQRAKKSFPSARLSNTINKNISSSPDEVINSLQKIAPNRCLNNFQVDSSRSIIKSNSSAPQKPYAERSSPLQLGNSVINNLSSKEISTKFQQQSKQHATISYGKTPLGPLAKNTKTFIANVSTEVLPSITPAPKLSRKAKKGIQKTTKKKAIQKQLKKVTLPEAVISSSMSLSIVKENTKEPKSTNNTKASQSIDGSKYLNILPKPLQSGNLTTIEVLNLKPPVVSKTTKPLQAVVPTIKVDPKNKPEQSKFNKKFNQTGQKDTVDETDFVTLAKNIKPPTLKVKQTARKSFPTSSRQLNEVLHSASKPAEKSPVMFNLPTKCIAKTFLNQYLSTVSMNNSFRKNITVSESDKDFSDWDIEEVSTDSSEDFHLSPHKTSKKTSTTKNKTKNLKKAAESIRHDNELMDPLTVFDSPSTFVAQTPDMLSLKDVASIHSEDIVYTMLKRPSTMEVNVSKDASNVGCGHEKTTDCSKTYLNSNKGLKLGSETTVNLQPNNPLGNENVTAESSSYGSDPIFLQNTELLNIVDFLNPPDSPTQTKPSESRNEDKESLEAPSKMLERKNIPQRKQIGPKQKTRSTGVKAKSSVTSKQLKYNSNEKSFVSSNSVEYMLTKSDEKLPTKYKSGENLFVSTKSGETLTDMELEQALLFKEPTPTLHQPVKNKKSIQVDERCTDIPARYESPEWSKGGYKITYSRSHELKSAKSVVYKKPVEAVKLIKPVKKMKLIKSAELAHPTECSVSDKDKIESIKSSFVTKSLKPVEPLQESLKLESVEPVQAFDESVEPVQAFFESVEPVEALDESVEPVEALDESVEPVEALGESVEPVQPFDESVDPVQALDESVEQVEALDESVEPVQALDESVEQVEALDESVEPVQALDESVEPVQALDESVEPVQALDESVEPVQALDESVEPVQALDESVEPVEALDVSVEPVEALDESVEPVEALDESVEPVQPFDESVEPTKSLDEFVEPVQDLDEFVEPVQDLDEFVEPVQDLDEFVEPVQDLDEFVEPVQHLDAFVEPVQDLDEFVEPVQDLDEFVEPVQDLDEFVEPVQDLDEFVEPVQALDKFVEPAQALDEFVEPAQALEEFVEPAKALDEFEKTPEPLEFEEPNETLEFVEPSETLEFVEPSETLEFVEHSETLEFVKPQETLEFVEPQETLEFVEPQETLEFVEPQETLEFVEPQETLEFVEPKETLEFVEPQETLEFEEPPEILEFEEPPEALEFVEPPEILEFVEPREALEFVEQPEALHVFVEQPEALHAFVEPPEALHAFVEPPEALDEFVEPAQALDEFVEPAQALDEFVEPAQALDEFVEPAQALDEFVEPAQALDEFVEPAQALDEFVEPAQALDEFVEPAQALDEFVEPAQALDEFVEPAPALDEFVEPAPALDEFVESAPALDEFVEPIRALDEFLEPTQTLDESIGPAEALGESMESLEALEKSVEPALVPDKLIKPGEDIDECMKRGDDIDESSVSVLPIDESPEPVLPIDESPEPVLPIDESPEPVLPIDESPEPVLPIDESPEPVLPLDESSELTTPVDPTHEDSTEPTKVIVGTTEAIAFKYSQSVKSIHAAGSSKPSESIVSLNSTYPVRYVELSKVDYSLEPDEDILGPDEALEGTLEPEVAMKSAKEVKSAETVEHKEGVKYKLSNFRRTLSRELRNILESSEVYKTPNLEVDLSVTETGRCLRNSRQRKLRDSKKTTNVHKSKSSRKLDISTTPSITLQKKPIEITDLSTAEVHKVVDRPSTTCINTPSFSDAETRNSNAKTETNSPLRTYSKQSLLKTNVESSNVVPVNVIISQEEAIKTTENIVSRTSSLLVLKPAGMGDSNVKPKTIGTVKSSSRPLSKKKHQVTEVESFTTFSTSIQDDKSLYGEKNSTPETRKPLRSNTIKTLSRKTLESQVESPDVGATSLVENKVKSRPKQSTNRAKPFSKNTSGIAGKVLSQKILEPPNLDVEQPSFCLEPTNLHFYPPRLCVEPPSLQVESLNVATKTIVESRPKAITYRPKPLSKKKIIEVKSPGPYASSQISQAADNVISNPIVNTSSEPGTSRTKPVIRKTKNYTNIAKKRILAKDSELEESIESHTEDFTGRLDYLALAIPTTRKRKFASSGVNVNSKTIKKSKRTQAAILKSKLKKSAKFVVRESLSMPIVPLQPTFDLRPTKRKKLRTSVMQFNVTNIHSTTSNSNKPQEQTMCKLKRGILKKRRKSVDSNDPKKTETKSVLPPSKKRRVSLPLDESETTVLNKRTKRRNSQPLKTSRSTKVKHVTTSDNEVNDINKAKIALLDFPRSQNLVEDMKLPKPNNLSELMNEHESLPISKLSDTKSSSVKTRFVLTKHNYPTRRNRMNMAKANSNSNDDESSGIKKFTAALSLTSVNELPANETISSDTSCQTSEDKLSTQILETVAKSTMENLVPEPIKLLAIDKVTVVSNVGLDNISVASNDGVDNNPIASKADVAKLPIDFEAGANKLLFTPDLIGSSVLLGPNVFNKSSSLSGSNVTDNTTVSTLTIIKPPTATSLSASVKNQSTFVSVEKSNLSLIPSLTVAKAIEAKKTKISKSASPSPNQSLSVLSPNLSTECSRNSPLVPSLPLFSRFLSLYQMSPSVSSFSVNSSTNKIDIDLKSVYLMVKDPVTKIYIRVPVEIYIKSLSKLNVILRQAILPAQKI